MIHGRTMGREAVTNLSLLFWNEQTHLGSTMSSLNDYREVMEQVFSGRMVPVVYSVHPFEQAPEAYARYERVNNLGRSS